MTERVRESIHLTTTHRPFDTRVYQKECRALAEAGFKVTLIVPHVQDEIRDNVQIRAVPLPQTGKERLKKTARLVYRAALKENPNAVFHFHDAELLPFMILLKLKGRTVIYDAHEDTPQQVKYQHWIPKWLRPPISLLMHILESAGNVVFDRLIAAEPVVASRFSAHKTATIHNYPLLDEFNSVQALPYTERPFDVAYAGGISAVRGIREMITAMEILQDRQLARLQLAGAFFPATLEAEVKSMSGWKTVDYSGWVSRESIAQTFSNVRAGLVILYPTQKYLDSYPTKLFEYMAAGLPVIASDFRQFRTLVEDIGCVLFVDPKDARALANAIQWIFDHPEEAEAMGQRGKQAVQDRFNWDTESERLVELYRGIPGP